MPFYTYKKHLKNGESVHPEFTTDNYRNFFFNEQDKTYVCFIPDEKDRDYYIPDTLVQLKRAELVERVGNIARSNRMSRLQDQQGNMTEEEARVWADSFYTDFMGDAE